MANELSCNVIIHKKDSDRKSDIEECKELSVNDLEKAEALKNDNDILITRLFLPHF